MVASLAGELAATLSGALQATLSVLLTIFYGVIAGLLGLVDTHGTQQMSNLCVQIFLPALLMTNVGSELKLENYWRYALIIVWALVYVSISLGISLGLKKIFRLPSWTVAAISFNNNISLPLLLVKTLATTGIFEALLIDKTDKVTAAVRRAQSYFLANALFGNVATFTLGPYILDGPKDQQDGRCNTNDRARQSPSTFEASHHDEETTPLVHEPASSYRTLNPGEMTAKPSQTHKNVYQILQSTFAYIYSLVNAPLMGGMAGIIVGLVPALQKAFFSRPRDGGILAAWLTTSIENVGDLFAALQVVIVGIRLSVCLKKWARGEHSGNIHTTGAVTILTIRYIIWPLMSIGLISFVYDRTDLFSSDPVLPFAMMLMPCGPPSMRLASLTDVADSSEEEKLTMAKFLAVSYVLSPLLAFAVVGGFKVTRATAV